MRLPRLDIVDKISSCPLCLGPIWVALDNSMLCFDLLCNFLYGGTYGTPQFSSKKAGYYHNNFTDLLNV